MPHVSSPEATSSSGPLVTTTSPRRAISHRGALLSRPAVTNAVLFERISNIAMSVDKMDTRLTQNFESLSHLLQDAYVKKEDLMALEKRIAKIEDFSLPQQRLEYTTEIRQRVH